MSRSQQLFLKAKNSIPGGVNSPVRAFKGVGGQPVFIKKAKGAYLIDEDDNHYIDYVGSWGPMILGHGHPAVLKAVQEALECGMSFGAPTQIEILLAEKIIELMPSIEKIRMMNSGTEATMTAIRLARGFTGRSKIIKLNGCYHGHSDSLLVKAGSGVLTLGLPACAGIPKEIAEHTLVADFNNLEQIAQLFETFGQEIAGVILEPIAGNMGMVLPKMEFLQGLRQLCDAHGSLLILDEVMTGFRVALGGAQSLYKISPDLTTLGKVIGGGMPVGALGGKASIMDYLAPDGPVYQAGTLSGNPLAMAAGLATLEQVEKPGFYDRLTRCSQSLIDGLNEASVSASIPFTGTAIGGMFGFSFNRKNCLENFDDVAASDESRFRSFYHEMLKKGVYFAPSMFEAGFVSSAHTQDDISQTVNAAKCVLKALQ